jgi:hypothetical protein
VAGLVSHLPLRITPPPSGYPQKSTKIILKFAVGFLHISFLRKFSRKRRIGWEFHVFWILEVPQQNVEAYYRSYNQNKECTNLNFVINCCLYFCTMEKNCITGSI